jgi:metallo-beta-lactamase family protein
MADLMLRDAAHIQESDTEYVNRKRERKGLPPVEPLYTVSEAAAVGDHLLPMKYDQEFEPVKGVTARLVEAGHILGSASIVLDVHEDGRKFRLWFSGDIGRYKLPLIKDPTLPENADYLMMECTYGDKLHPDPDEAYREFRQTVQAAIKRGGKVIIPLLRWGAPRNWCMT